MEAPWIVAEVESCTVPVIAPSVVDWALAEKDVSVTTPQRTAPLNTLQTFKVSLHEIIIPP
jgi:murein L,D-transpeptidase YcbB/YkuD